MAWQTFSIKTARINFFCFAGHMVSTATFTVCENHCRQYVNKWACMCYNKTLFTKAGGRGLALAYGLSLANLCSRSQTGVGAQSWAGLLSAGRDHEGWQDDISFSVNPLKWQMSLHKITGRFGEDNALLYMLPALRSHWNKPCKHFVDSEFQELLILSPIKISLPLSLPFWEKLTYFSVLELCTKGSFFIFFLKVDHF